MQETTIKQETSHQLFKIVEDGDIFEPLRSVNQMPGKYLSFEYCSDDEDGTFPRVSDYTRLANKIDNEGASAFLTWIGKSKLKFETGYCTVIRESSYSNEATLVFKEPIKMVMGYLNDEPVLVEVDKIEGEFTYEWYWSRNPNRRQTKIANSFEIYFECKKLYNTKKGN